jgi:hypothetical protein
MSESTTVAGATVRARSGPLRLRAVMAVATAAVALLLGSCWSAPVPDGPATPVPVETSATPFEQDRLELEAQRCGLPDAAPPTDGAFVGEARWPSGLLPNGMTVPVSVRVELESDHGDHTVDLGRTWGSVTDAGGGTVLGLMTGVATPGGASSAPAPAISAPIVVSLGSCPPPGEDGEIGSPLPDGDYDLVLSGPVSPDDHAHDQQEYWVAAPLSFSVAGGEVTLGTG